MNSHLLSICLTTAALEISPLSPLGTTCAIQAPPVALLTPATWSTGTGTDLCSPTTCQLGSSLYSGCQETCCKPTRYQTFYVVSRPSQISCYHSRTSTLCRPSKTTYSGSLGFGSSNSCSLGYGSGSSYLPGCGSSSFRPVACRVHESSLCHSLELTSPVNMSYCRCSGNFSSRSLGDHLRYSGFSCGSSYPSNLIYSTDRCYPSSCHLGSSLQSGCYEPIRHPATAQGPPCSTVLAGQLMLGFWALGPAEAAPWAMDPEAATHWAFDPMASDPWCNSAELLSPIKMPYNCCSGNFSSHSFGGYHNLVYSTDLCSPNTCQLDSCLYSQETCCEPTRCQTSCVVSSRCQTSCYHPRTSTVCWKTYPGSLGFRFSSCNSLSSGSGSCYSLGCGSNGFRPRVPSSNSAELTSPVNISCNCCSGNFSSSSLDSHLRYPGSFYSSNLVYSTDLYSLSTCQLGSCLYSGCQETCYEPTMCQAFSVVSSPCQTSCYQAATHWAVDPVASDTWVIESGALLPWAMDPDSATQPILIFSLSVDLASKDPFIECPDLFAE
ncbi:hypothetical protein E2I00_003810 [Balaenoptera physalus]|uniref:Keratin-associated protein n=1 Tax=Balaenoptera physalus TaxID=9770 RepID=A0A643BL31_BALPH|nr:hypothetical protein E2I00_003810 [Balaenoptera physalus]